MKTVKYPVLPNLSLWVLRQERKEIEYRRIQKNFENILLELLGKVS